jgi:hypothetical protein
LASPVDVVVKSLLGQDRLDVGLSFGCVAVHQQGRRQLQPELRRRLPGQGSLEEHDLGHSGRLGDAAGGDEGFDLLEPGEIGRAGHVAAPSTVVPDTACRATWSPWMPPS